MRRKKKFTSALSFVLSLLMSFSCIQPVMATQTVPDVESVSEEAATQEEEKQTTNMLSFENKADQLSVELTKESDFDPGSTAEIHLLKDNAYKDLVENLKKSLEAKNKGYTVSLDTLLAAEVNILDDGGNKKDAGKVSTKIFTDASALKDSVLYHQKEDQTWEEIQFETAEDASYVAFDAEKLGNFVFAKVSETDISTDESVVAQEHVREVEKYAYDDADVRVSNLVNNVYWWYDGSSTTLHLSNKAETNAYQLVPDGQPWSEYSGKITQVVLDTEIQPTSTKSWFSGCKALTNLDFSDKLNTVDVTDMGSMFKDCSSLISLNLGDKFDTSNVTNMESMFRECSSLEELNLGSRFDTSNSMDMYSMFDGCSSLKSLNLGDKFDTSNVRSIPYIFMRCSSLKSLDLGDKFDTSRAIDMSSMFYECSSLKELNLGSRFDTGYARWMSCMFEGCSSLTSLNLGDKFDTSNAESMSSMFEGCSSLTSLNLGDKFDTSRAKSMRSMFYECSSLKSLNLGDKFDTSNAESMSSMFEGCSSLTSLNLGDKFDTSRAKSMRSMFYECSSLKSLNLGDKFDTSRVTTMGGMFYGCSRLTSLNLGDKFDTSNAGWIGSMFSGCSRLTSLNLGDKFDTSNVTMIEDMFKGCNSLTSLNLGDKFDTSNARWMSSMFEECRSLTSLDLGDKFDTSNVTNVKDVANMFKGCDALQKLVSQKSGRQDIELPRKMIEQDSQDGVVYSVMPSGSKILVPFTLSVAESITSTTVVMRASMDKSFENVPVFEFGVYREDGTLVDTVKNDRDGNIVIETKDYALGRYYVQEKAGTAVNIIYDTSKYYFTVSEVQEKVTGVNVSHGNKQVMYYTLVKPSLLTGNNLQLSGFSGVTVTDSEGNPHTLRAYCANLAKHVPCGTAKQVYINPTDAEINEARGDVYTGPQENLSDAIRCILYFENENAQQRIWDLLNRGAVIDTSRVDEIPAEFQFAIITPPSFDMQPLIVPLADIRVEDKVVMEEITTGIVRKRVVTLETPVSVFENRTSSKTYVIKQDEDGNVLYGAKLSLWKDGKLVRSFTTTAAIFGEVLADGDYILREDEAPYGYEKAADISFQVKDHVAYQNGAAVSENTIVMTDKALPTLTVSKKVTGSFGDKYKDFKFYLTLDDDSITSLSYMKGDATETVTRNADNQFEFTLSHGESVVFADLPVGTGYTVTEPDAKAEGYEVTADGATGTIQENGSTVLFTNNRNMVVPTELDTNMAVFGMILAAGCVLLIGYCLKRRKK